MPCTHLLGLNFKLSLNRNASQGWIYKIGIIIVRYMYQLLVPIRIIIDIQ